MQIENVSLIHDLDLVQLNYYHHHHNHLNHQCCHYDLQKILTIYIKLLKLRDEYFNLLLKL
jgi:hypothetical protein